MATTGVSKLKVFKYITPVIPSCSCTYSRDFGLGRDRGSLKRDEGLFEF